MSRILPLCECGCGERVAYRRRRYLDGHTRFGRRAAGRIIPQHFTVEDRGHETPCWIHKSRSSKTYPGVSHEGQLVSVHVASYIQFVGPVPDGHVIYHLCHQTWCLNPEHLQALPVLEHTRLRRNLNLSIEAARDIRTRRLSVAGYAEKYDVKERAIYNVLEGNTWRE